MRYDVAREAGMGGRINTVMQTCFFALAERAAARARRSTQIKEAIKKTYGKTGRDDRRAELRRGRRRPGRACTR